MAGFCVLLLSLPCLQIQNTNQTAESTPDAESPAPATEWRKKFFEELEPLKNTPRVIEIERRDNDVLVSVANRGRTSLEYFSAGREHIQLFQETEEDQGWKIGRWDGCGTGKKVYTIEPGERAFLKIRFWDDEKRERMLGVFTEKETKRSGLVVLAVEPDED